MRNLTLWRILAVICVVIGCACGQSETDRPFQPSQQQAITLDEPTFTALLAPETPFAIAVTPKKSNMKTRITLPAELAQVDSLQPVGDQRLAVFGRVNGSVSEVIILDPSTDKPIDFFLCYSPTLSPNHHLLAYIKFYPAHSVDGTSDEYLLYDFKRSPRENRSGSAPQQQASLAGRVLYPAGRTNRIGDNTGLAEDETHHLASDGLFWAPDSQRLIFVDTFKQQLSTVLIDFPPGAVPIVRERTFRDTEICPEAIQKQQSRACTARVSRIETDPKEPSRLKVFLAPYEGGTRTNAVAEINLKEFTIAQGGNGRRQRN